MAAIDKIYVRDYKQYEQFRDWCIKQPKLKDAYGTEVSISQYLYKYDEPFYGEHPIFMAPYYIDAYVIRNCPFDFIQEEMKTNYGEWSQSFKEEAYKTVMDRGGEKGNKGEVFYWLSKDDFEIVDGVVTMPRKKKSSYQLIKEGLLYAKPTSDAEYIIGKHCRCTKHPVRMYNTPYGCKRWWIDVIVPDNLPYMWYHEKTNTWDFADAFVLSTWSSSTAHCRTIRALKRLMRKWKFPVGTRVRVTGRYVGDDYEFLITK